MTDELLAQGFGDASGDEHQLALARELLRLTFDDQIPTGPLGPATVPASVLELPIQLATTLLVRHAKRCRDRVHCDLYPPQLAKFRRMRPEEALPRERDNFHRAIWTTPEHKLITDVRRQLIERYPELAEAVTSGSLFRDGRLPALTLGIGKTAPMVLASVLWATRFAGPGAEELFRLLVPVVVNRTVGTAIPRQAAESRGSRPPPGNDSRVTDLRDANRELKRRLRQAQQAADGIASTLRARDAALAALRREFDDASETYRESVTKADALEKRVSSLTAGLEDVLATYDSIERQANRADRTNTELRRDLQTAQRTQRDFEAQRAEFMREAAGLRRQLEQLKVQLMSMPTGPAAVWQFLQQEEERLATERLITAGGAKERANESWTAHRKLKQAFLAAHPEFMQPQPIRLVRKAPLRLITLGGSAEIGRSCYLLELGQNRILVDCGIKPNATDEPHPRLDGIERLDALLLTHAHTDHVGWVAALIRRFPDLEIYCSAGTASLLPVMLEDCRKHYTRELAVANEHARFNSTRLPIAEDYDETDMQRVSKRTVTCEFDTREGLPFGGVTVQFYRAGHILGAASILIEDQSGRRVFFSGDFSSFPQLTMSAARWPEDLGVVDLLVLESTYGGRIHPSFDASRAELVNFIRETNKRGGSVILASFALGRAQELLKLVLLARESGDLPDGTPIFVDGMIKRINPIYQKYGSVELALDSVNEVSGDTERREVAEKAQRTPSIIVTTSGMLTGGPVVEYARRLLPDSRHRIVFTGYQDEGAPSRALLDLTRSSGPWPVTIEDEDGEYITFKAARRAQLVQLSSHADQRGLLEYSRRLAPQQIALVHGNPAGQEKLRVGLSEIHRRAEIACGPTELVVP